MADKNTILIPEENSAAEQKQVKELPNDVSFLEIVGLCRKIGEKELKDIDEAYALIDMLVDMILEQ